MRREETNPEVAEDGVAKGAAKGVEEAADKFGLLQLVEQQPTDYSFERNVVSASSHSRRGRRRSGAAGFFSMRTWRTRSSTWMIIPGIRAIKTDKFKKLIFKKSNPTAILSIVAFCYLSSVRVQLMLRDGATASASAVAGAAAAAAAFADAAAVGAHSQDDDEEEEDAFDGIEGMEKWAGTRGVRKTFFSHVCSNVKFF